MGKFLQRFTVCIKRHNDGRFPSPPARDLYFITKGKPQDKALLDFFKWTLTEGQKYVKESGFVPLPDERIKEELKKLAEP